MERADHRTDRLLLSWIQRGARSLPKIDLLHRAARRAVGTLSGGLKRIRSAAWLVLAGILALGALSLSRDHAQREWEERSFPPAPLLDRWLGSEGYSLLKDPALIQRWIRFLPIRAESRFAIWRDETGGSFLIWIPGSGEPRVYLSRNLKDRRIPTRWSPLGAGWSSLSELSAILQAKAAQTPTAPPKRAREGADPRAFHY